MEELPPVDTTQLLELIQVAGDNLKKNLTQMQQFQALWMGIDQQALENAVSQNGREAAAALHRIMNEIVSDAGVSEAVFLTGRPLIPGEALPSEIERWASSEQMLFELAIGERPGAQVTAFVIGYRRCLSVVAELAGPRLRYWKNQPRSAPD